MHLCRLGTVRTHRRMRLQRALLQRSLHQTPPAASSAGPATHDVPFISSKTHAWTNEAGFVKTAKRKLDGIDPNAPLRAPPLERMRGRDAIQDDVLGIASHSSLDASESEMPNASSELGRMVQSAKQLNSLTRRGVDLPAPEYLWTAPNAHPDSKYAMVSGPLGRLWWSTRVKYTVSGRVRAPRIARETWNDGAPPAVKKFIRRLARAGMDKWKIRRQRETLIAEFDAILQSGMAAFVPTYALRNMIRVYTMYTPERPRLHPDSHKRIVPHFLDIEHRVKLWEQKISSLLMLLQERNVGLCARDIGHLVTQYQTFWHGPGMLQCLALYEQNKVPIPTNMQLRILDTWLRWIRVHETWPTHAFDSAHIPVHSRHASQAVPPAIPAADLWPKLTLESPFVLPAGLKNRSVSSSFLGEKGLAMRSARERRTQDAARALLPDVFRLFGIVDPEGNGLLLHNQVAHQMMKLFLYVGDQALIQNAFRALYGFNYRSPGDPVSVKAARAEQDRFEKVWATRVIDDDLVAHMIRAAANPLHVHLGHAVALFEYFDSLFIPQKDIYMTDIDPILHFGSLSERVRRARPLVPLHLEHIYDYKLNVVESDSTMYRGLPALFRPARSPISSNLNLVPRHSPPRPPLAYPFKADLPANDPVYANLEPLLQEAHEYSIRSTLEREPNSHMDFGSSPSRLRIDLAVDNHTLVLHKHRTPLKKIEGMPLTHFSSVQGHIAGQQSLAAILRAAIHDRNPLMIENYMNLFIERWQRSIEVHVAEFERAVAGRPNESSAVSSPPLTHAALTLNTVTERHTDAHAPSHTAIHAHALAPWRAHTGPINLDPREVFAHPYSIDPGLLSELISTVGEVRELIPIVGDDGTHTHISSTFFDQASPTAPAPPQGHSLSVGQSLRSLGRSLYNALLGTPDASSPPRLLDDSGKVWDEDLDPESHEPLFVPSKKNDVRLALFVYRSLAKIFRLSSWYSDKLSVLYQSAHRLPLNVLHASRKDNVKPNSSWIHGHSVYVPEPIADADAKSMFRGTTFIRSLKDALVKRHDMSASLPRIAGLLVQSQYLVDAHWANDFSTSARLIFDECASKLGLSFREAVLFVQYIQETFDDPDAPKLDDAERDLLLQAKLLAQAEIIQENAERVTDTIAHASSEALRSAAFSVLANPKRVRLNDTPSIKKNPFSEEPITDLPLFWNSPKPRNFMHPRTTDYHLALSMDPSEPVRKTTKRSRSPHPGAAPESYVHDDSVPSSTYDIYQHARSDVKFSPRELLWIDQRLQRAQNFVVKERLKPAPGIYNKALQMSHGTRAKLIRLQNLRERILARNEALKKTLPSSTPLADANRENE